MIQPAPIAHVEISPEVTAFAAEQGVSTELPAVVAMTQRTYPNAVLTVEVEDDPEIPNDRHIVINAEGVNLSVPEAVEKTWEWHRELFGCCPAPLACVFRVSLRGVR
jgi:hypothetical protein